MMGKETKRLGRGLNSLISRTVPVVVEERQSSDADEHTIGSDADEGGVESESASSGTGVGTGGGDGTGFEPINVGSASVAQESVSEATRRSGMVGGSSERMGEGSLVPMAHGTTPRTSGVEGGEGRPVESRSSMATLPETVTAHSTQFVASVDMIVPHSGQPRVMFNPKSIAQLAASIARQGVIQPLVVRPLAVEDPSDGAERQYEIVAGERRWRAAKAAGLSEVPVVIRDIEDEEALEIALVENIQREDLNAIDRAKAYRRYCEEFGVSAEGLAQRLAEDRTTVVNYMRLLELPEPVKDLVAQEQLSMGHARCLLGVVGEEERVDLARAAVTNSLSVRALEDVVRRRKVRGHKGGASVLEKPLESRSANVADLENRLQQAVGTRVTIKEGRRKGRGRIVVEYYSFDDFERISRMLGLGSE